MPRWLDKGIELLSEVPGAGLEATCSLPTPCFEYGSGYGASSRVRADSKNPVNVGVKC